MADYKIRSLEEIETALEGKVTFEQVIQAAVVLTSMGAFAPAEVDAALVSRLKLQTDRLNQELMRRARSSSEIAYLASPVTGAAFTSALSTAVLPCPQPRAKKRHRNWLISYSIG